MMGMHLGQIDRAVDAALAAQATARRLYDEGQISAAGWQRLAPAQTQAVAEIERAQAYDRVAESIRRIGEPNPYVMRMFSEHVPWLARLRPTSLRHKRAA